jgi:NAD-dependent dihydropyrimidine dehydrogenase PreA subunit
MALMRRLYIKRIWDREAELSTRPGWIRSADDSPERFEIVAEGFKQGWGAPPAMRKAMPHMMASMRGIDRSLRTVDRNPAEPKTYIPAAERAELEELSRALGVDDLGYARVSETLVFRDKAVLHPNAIVLTMEMDKRRIDTSPSEQSFVAVHETYHHLGVASNKIADHLRRRGYSAHAGHPLMGLALYPPLAQQAGLGWRGLHGLLITPRFGPRVRLAAVFTSIQNLPSGQENDHRWIEEYCRLCKLCARECPPQAVLEQPVENANGLVTCTLSEKCFPYFMDNYGCSICIRVCPFQEQDYALLKNHV